MINTYVYPWHTDEVCSIGKVMARNYHDCEKKIIEKYFDKYEDLTEDSEYQLFLDELYDKHGIIIGDIYDISEFE